MPRVTIPHREAFVARDDSSGGLLKLILIPIVIAVLTGGSAPFWWKYIFPPAPAKQSGTGADSQPPFPIGIGACSTGYLKPSNSFANSPAPNGSWDWNCDGQVTPNYQSCETLSPAQCTPNSNATGSRGGFCADLREKGCSPAVPKCGKSGYVYPCFIQADGACHAGGYPTPVTVGCK